MSEPDILDKRSYPKTPVDAIQLVSKNDQGKDITTSLIVSSVFGKQHKHVLDSIVDISCSEEFRKRNFRLSSYKSSQGKTIPMFEITKDGFSFLGMGYTGKKASRFKEMFIKEFNRRESMLKSEDYILNRAMVILANRVKALENGIGKAKTIIAEQQYVISEQHPKAVYHDEVLQSKTGYTATTIAKELGMSAIKLNRILNKKKIIFKRDKHWVLYALYQNREYMITRTTLIENEEVTFTTIDSRWTEKGRRFIHMVINKELRKKTN